MPKKERGGIIKRSDAVGGQALRLYAKGLALMRQGEDYSAEEKELHRLLNLRPWQPTVFQVELRGTPQPTPGGANNEYWKSYPAVQTLRRELHNKLRGRTDARS